MTISILRAAAGIALVAAAPALWAQAAAVPAKPATAAVPAKPAAKVTVAAANVANPGSVAGSQPVASPIAGMSPEMAAVKMTMSVGVPWRN